MTYWIIENIDTGRELRNTIGSIQKFDNFFEAKKVADLLKSNLSDYRILKIEEVYVTSTLGEILDKDEENG